MRSASILTTAIASLAAVSTVPYLAAAEPKIPTIAELLKKLQKLEKEHEILKKELNKVSAKAMEKSKEGIRGASGAAAKTKFEDTKSKFSLDTPMPAEPAFVAMGLAGSDVPELQTPRKFGAGLINGVDKNGKLKQGVAVSTNIGLAYDYVRNNLIKRDAPRDALIPAYRSRDDERPWLVTFDANEAGNWLIRSLYRSNLSLATARGAEKDDKSLRLAVGLSVTVYDRYDPYTIFHSGDDGKGNQELSRVLAELGLLKGPDNKDGFDPRIRPGELTDEDKDKILQKINETRWLRSGVQLGVAPTWFGADSKLQHLHYEGYNAYLTTTWITQFWTHPKMQVDSKGKEHEVLDPTKNLLGLTAHAQYRNGEQFSDSATGRTGRQDTLFAAGRLTFGSKDINAAAEGGYLKIWDGPSGDEDAWQVGGAVSLRVAKDVYFVVSTGRTFGARDEYYATGAFRFGTSDTADLIPKTGAK